MNAPIPEAPGNRRLTLAFKPERLERANRCLAIIAAHGRGFFAHAGRISRLEVRGGGKVWLVDCWRERSVCLSCRSPHWSQVSTGGTLHDLLRDLVRYVQTGTRVPAHHLGPWPDRCCQGDLWGYGPDMAAVRQQITALEILTDLPVER